MLEGMEPEWQSTMMDVLASMPEAAMIYIGRSDAYVDTFKPRVLHLEALHAKPEAKVVAKAPNAPAPALSDGLHRRDGAVCTDGDVCCRTLLPSAALSPITITRAPAIRSAFPAGAKVTIGVSSAIDIVFSLP